MTEKTPLLGNLYINPAGGCNLHCRHCWVSEGVSAGGTLSLKDWEELLLQAKQLGCSYVKLTGGEPLLYEEAVSLYSFAAANFPRVAIETNGTVQPDGLWEAFRENSPFHVSVSIDSARPEVHDSFRGVDGAWKKTVDFAERLVGMHVSNQVIMSVSAADREQITEMVGLVREMGVDSLKINFIEPLGRGKGNSFFEMNSIRQVLDFFDWIDRETPPWVLPSVPPALLPVNRLKSSGRCPVRNLMGVLPDGTFSLCGVAFYRKDMAWGRFPEVSVEQAWTQSPVYGLIRTSVPYKLEGVCHRCMHRDSCVGSCVVNNLEAGGSITSPHTVCQMAFDAGLFPETRLIDR